MLDITAVAVKIANSDSNPSPSPPYCTIIEQKSEIVNNIVTLMLIIDCTLLTN